MAGTSLTTERRGGADWEMVWGHSEPHLLMSQGRRERKIKDDSKPERQFILTWFPICGEPSQHWQRDVGSMLLASKLVLGYTNFGSPDHRPRWSRKPKGSC